MAEEQEQIIELDLETLTMGELLAAEVWSGVSGDRLLALTGHRRLLAIFVHHFRNSEKPPTWQELTHRRVLDMPAGRSRSPVTSPSQTSSG